MDNIADVQAEIPVEMPVQVHTTEPTINTQWQLTQLDSKIPEIHLWGITPAVFPLSDVWEEYLNKLKTLQEDNRFRVPLNPLNFRENGFKTPLLKAVVDVSRTVDIEPKDGFTQKDFRTLLTYRELYRYVLGTFLASRIEVRVEALKAKAVGRRKERIAAGEEKIRIKGIPIRTFHIQDNAAESIKALSPVIHQVEFETGSTLMWQLLTTYTNSRDEVEKCEHIKNKSQWIGGVSGDGCNLANVRSWTNNLAIRLKGGADVIVINGTSDTVETIDAKLDMTKDTAKTQLNTALAIGLVILNLNLGGCAMISLEEFHSPLLISCIHLFSMCFSNVRVIHTRAEDRLFLCGINFTGGMSSRHVNKIFDITDINQSLFATEYMNEPSFISTVETLLTIIRHLTSWRLDQYTKMISIFRDLSLREHEMSAVNNHERILRESYPSIAKEWSIACKYE